MSPVIPYILVIVCCIVLSAYFSATETAFSSLNRIRLKNMARDGDKKAALALRQEDNFDKILSTILVGNNLVNILSTGLATVVFTTLYGDLGVTLSTVVMTLLLLLFGEISPKSLAKQKAESFAMFSAPILRVFTVLLMPLTWFFGLWKKLLNRLFKAPAEDAISEEELITIVEEAEEEGSLDEHESRLIRSAIEFNEQEVGEILTSRVNLTAVEETADAAEVERLFHDQGFSRLPVYRGNIDNIVGVIHEKDFYHLRYMGGQNWQEAMTPAIIVAPSTGISALLRRLQRGKMHLAVVVDEFGGTMGIVTLEDILEELVGEIWDEHDEVSQNIRSLPTGKYNIQGACPFEEFLDYFHLEDREGRYDAQTVGGFVTEHLTHIPEVGEVFSAFSMDITVTKADERRVLEIQVAAAGAKKEK